MANNALENELNRIADLYEETGRLEQQYAQLPDMARQEIREFINQSVANLQEYQNGRESEINDLVLDLKWLREHPIPQKPAFPKMEEYVLPQSSQKNDESSKDGKKVKEQAEKRKTAKDIMDNLTWPTLHLGCLTFGISLILAYILYQMFSVPGKVTILVVVALFLLLRPFFKASSYNDFKVYLEILDRNKKKMEGWKAEVEQWVEAKRKWAEDLEKLGCETLVSEVCAAVETYDAEFYKMVADCDAAFAEANERLEAKRKEIQEKYLLKGEKINQKIQANNRQLDDVTLLHPNMFSRAAKFAEAIRMGRADTVKEAINIVLDDERRAEEEAQRRREAAARQATLERQAAEARRHNEEMERAAAEQAAEARRHNEEVERSANERSEADRKERIRMAQKRCRNCAHVMGCSVSYRTQSTGAVCPSFEPRK